MKTMVLCVVPVRGWTFLIAIITTGGHLQLLPIVSTRSADVRAAG